jgi:hypothetical protein
VEHIEKYAPLIKYLSISLFPLVTFWTYHLPRTRHEASQPNPRSQPRHGGVGGEERGRPPSSMQQRSPANHPVALLQTTAREALGTDPRRPPHRRRGLGRQAPQGAGRGIEEEEVAAWGYGFAPWSPWRRHPEERGFFSQAGNHSKLFLLNNGMNTSFANIQLPSFHYKNSCRR